MTFFKRAMGYLGLGPEEDYDDYDAPPPERPPASRRSGYGPDDMTGGTGAPVRSVPPRDRSGRDPSGERPRRTDAGDDAPPREGRRSGATSAAPVRPAPAVNVRPHAVTPQRFDQAQEVADKYKEGQPVIVNLQNVDKDLSRRLIDFASGLCYGLNGSMERVAQGVYMLTPAGVSVSDEDRRGV